MINRFKKNNKKSEIFDSRNIEKNKNIQISNEGKNNPVSTHSNKKILNKETTIKKPIKNISEQNKQNRDYSKKAKKFKGSHQVQSKIE